MDARLEDAPDGVGREILPAAEPDAPTSPVTSEPLNMPEEWPAEDSDDTLIQADGTWLLEDGR